MGFEMVIGLLIFTMGAMIYMINKMMKCSGYWIGYFGVILQGVGIGIILCEIYPILIYWHQDPVITIFNYSI